MIFNNVPDHKRIWEALPKIDGKTIPTPEAKIVNYQQYNQFGNEPDVPFATLIKYKDSTPQIYISVSTYRDLITGTNITINSDNDKAKQVIEDWNNRTDFFTKWCGAVETILTCGATLLEKLDESTLVDVLEVDMKTIVGKKRDDFGFTEAYIQLQRNNETKPLVNLKKYIEFSLTSSSRSIWGRSLFYPLAVSRTVGNRTTKPLVEQLWALEDALTAIPVNHAYPKEYHIFPNADNTALDKAAIKIQKWKPGDKWVGTQMPEVNILETKGDSKYTDYINYFGKTIQLGTQFPADIMTGDFTSRASSETTDNMVMKRVAGFKRYLANKLKTELYDRILEISGIDPKEANLQVSFTEPDILVLTVEQVTKLYEDKAITISEFREYLKNKKAMDLFDDAQIEADIQQQDQMKQDQLQAQQDQTKQQQDTIQKYNTMKERAKQIKKDMKK